MFVCTEKVQKRYRKDTEKIQKNEVNRRRGENAAMTNVAKAARAAKVLPVAIVTGASRGIGKAIVKKLSKEGFSCIAIASSQQSISRITKEDHLFFTHEHQRHRSLAIDLAQWPQWTLEGKYAGIDHYDEKSDFYSLFELWKQDGVIYRPNLLVNCAGVTQDTLSIKTSTESMSRIMNVNFMSCVSLSNLTVRQMIRYRRHACEEKPCIINVSSIIGVSDIVVPGTSTYAASKAALSRYTRVLSEELRQWDIRVLSTAPGLVSSTDMVQRLDRVTQLRLQDTMAKTGTLTPEDVASRIWDIYKQK